MNQSFRIVHLARDEKFVDMGLRAFELAAPGRNELCLYAWASPRFVRHPAGRVFGRKEALLGIPKSYLDQFSLVILHSLNPVFYRSIVAISPHIPVVWLGWGYDYYDLIFHDPGEALLKRTRASDVAEAGQIMGRLRSWLVRMVIALALPSKKALIPRISIFAPVLPGEYAMVRERWSGGRFPRYARWNYGTLEDDLIRGFEQKQVVGNSILVGNNASHSNNHEEIFRFLVAVGGSQPVLVPLSYGSAASRETILSRGCTLLGARFSPVVEFLAIQEYVQMLLACGFVIMNHVRQQAVGNIVIMLYLGAKIFLREECPTYTFLKELGCRLHSVQDLERNPGLLDVPLDDVSKNVNREIVKGYWGRETSARSTRELLAMVGWSGLSCAEG